MIYDKNEYGDDEISSSSCQTSFTYLMFHPASCSKGPHPVALGQPTGRGWGKFLQARYCLFSMTWHPAVEVVVVVNVMIMHGSDKDYDDDVNDNIVSDDDDDNNNLDNDHDDD